VERSQYWLSYASAQSGCPTLCALCKGWGIELRSTVLLHPPQICHLDRSAAQWRDPRIGSLTHRHNLGALPFAHFAKGGVSSSARQFSSTHHKFVISTGAQRSGEIPVLALSRIGTIWVPYPLRTLQRVGYREATALPTPPSPPPQPFSKSAHSQPAPVYWRMAESSTPHSTRFYEGPQ